MTDTKVIEGVNGVHVKPEQKQYQNIYFLLANLTNMVNMHDYICILLLKRIYKFVNGKSNMQRWNGSVLKCIRTPNIKIVKTALSIFVWTRIC